MISGSSKCQGKIRRAELAKQGEGLTWRHREPSDGRWIFGEPRFRDDYPVGFVPSKGKGRK
jgi:hypothetical protein